MAYKVTDEIAKYLPPATVSTKPLEFQWDEAANAILFTSNFNKKSFSDWKKGLSSHYRTTLGDIPSIIIESHSKLGCISFWINLDPDNLPKGNISVDVSAAWCPKEESVENLNAWIGSSLLESMVKKDKPSMAGLIRIRPAQ